MSAQGGIQHNYGSGRGRGGRGGRGRGRGRGRGQSFGQEQFTQGHGQFSQGQGQEQFGQGQNHGFINYNDNRDSYKFNPRFGNYKQKQFISPPIPKEFYQLLNSKFNQKKEGKEELKYPVINIHRQYIIKKFKNNSIISPEILREINPGDYDAKLVHFKKIYCSPNGVPNDGLFIEFRKFIKEILE